MLTLRVGSLIGEHLEHSNKKLCILYFKRTFYLNNRRQKTRNISVLARNNNQ